MTSAVLRPVRWWAGPLLLAATALAFDAAKRRIPFGVWSTGPVDEVAHLCTAALGLLVLACFIDAPRRFYAAALIASVAIDLDHIPLYLGLLGNEGERPVTHSLSSVAVFAAAVAASRRHRAVLAGVATGLVLHFARDIAEGYPGVLVFWPLQDSSWMVGYRWSLGMIVVLAAARLVLLSADLPHTRIPVFGTPSPPGAIPRSPDGAAASDDRRPGLETQGPDPEAAREARSHTSLRRRAFVPSALAVRPANFAARWRVLGPTGGGQSSRQMPKAGEGDPCNHRADACESIQVTSNYLANLGQDAHRQRARDKRQFRVQARSFPHIGEYLYLSSIDEVAPPPKIVPRCSSGWHEMMYNSQWLI
jgi:inner membrane protein